MAKHDLKNFLISNAKQYKSVMRDMNIVPSISSEYKTTQVYNYQMEKNGYSGKVPKPMNTLRFLEGFCQQTNCVQPQLGCTNRRASSRVQISRMQQELLALNKPTHHPEWQPHQAKALKSQILSNQNIKLKNLKSM